MHHLELSKHCMTERQTLPIKHEALAMTTPSHQHAPPPLPPSYRQHRRRRVREPFATSTLVPRREQAANTFNTLLVTSTTTTSPCMPSGVDQRETIATTITSSKTFDSLKVDLYSQAKKLDDSIHSLAASVNTKDYMALFPKRGGTVLAKSNHVVVSKHESPSFGELELLQSPEAVSNECLFLSSLSQSSFAQDTLIVKEESNLTTSIDKPSAFPITELTIFVSTEEPIQSEFQSSQAEPRQKQRPPIPHNSKRRSFGSGTQETLSSGESVAEQLLSKLPQCDVNKTKSVQNVATESQATISTQPTTLTDDSTKQPSTKTSISCSSNSADQHSSANIPSALCRFISLERCCKYQIDSLTESERTCLAILRQQWEVNHHPMPALTYLQFGRYCRFEQRTGRKMMSKFQERYLKLTAAQLEPQLLTQTLFPLPGLKSINDLDMFYLRPALHIPHLTNSQNIMDNLAYVMLTMVEKEEAATNGIGCIAFLNDCSLENFSVDYCRQLMKMLQGGVPARVRLFLIVNPPSWFGTIWKIMRPMLHSTFRRQVMLIPERKLSQYLAPGYSTYLPSDTAVGTLDTRQLVRDFVSYRKYVEEKRVRGTGW